MKIHYKLMTGVLVHDISSYDLISSCEITFAQTFQTNPCNDFNIVTWINFVVHNATDFHYMSMLSSLKFNMNLKIEHILEKTILISNSNSKMSK